MTTNFSYREIFIHQSMSDKVLNKHISIYKHTQNACFTLNIATADVEGLDLISYVHVQKKTAK